MGGAFSLRQAVLSLEELLSALLAGVGGTGGGGRGGDGGGAGGGGGGVWGCCSRVCAGCGSVLWVLEGEGEREREREITMWHFLHCTM